MNVEPSSKEKGNHEHAEHSASILRDKIVRTFRQLDQRLDDLDLRSQLRSHPISFAMASSGLVLALAGVTIAVLESKRRNRLDYKIKRNIRRALSAF